MECRVQELPVLETNRTPGKEEQIIEKCVWCWAPSCTAVFKSITPSVGLLSKQCSVNTRHPSSFSKNSHQNFHYGLLHSILPVA